MSDVDVQAVKPAVVFLHGLAGSSQRTWADNGWFALLDDAGRQPIGIDLLGHGTSPKPHEPEAYAHFYEHVLEQLPKEPVDAIGFSLGAATLLTVAAQAPERFRKLVVTGAGRNLFQQDTSQKEMVANAITGNPDPQNPHSRHFAHLAKAPDVDPQAVAIMMSALPLFDPRCLSQITVPTLVVLGDEDFAWPADELLEALPNAQLKVLKGIDHFATPKSFAVIDAALAFLDAQPL